MKIAAIVMMAVLAGTPARGAKPAQTRGQEVIVCMEGGTPFGLDSEGHALASKILAQIGVTILWRRGLRGCPSQGILISLSHATPRTLKPGALAYALPYEGAHIRVFYDRIASDRVQVSVPTLLGHVLVHEIVHILQGVSQHSDRGIMKAQWDGDDFSEMRCKPLVFTDADIRLIHLGLQERSRRAGSSPPPLDLRSAAMQQMQ